jgi:hypothetical protein
MMAKADCYLPQDLRDRVGTLIAAKGLVMAAKLLGVAVVTLKCANAGLPIQRGTLALLGQRVAERDATGRVP